MQRPQAFSRGASLDQTNCILDAVTVVCYNLVGEFRELDAVTIYDVSLPILPYSFPGLSRHRGVLVRLRRGADHRPDLRPYFDVHYEVHASCPRSGTGGGVRDGLLGVRVQ